MQRYNYNVNEFLVRSDFPLPYNTNCLTFQPTSLRELQIHRTSLENIPCSLRHIRPQASYDVGNGILIDRCKWSLLISFTGEDISVDTTENYLASAMSWITGIGMALATTFTGGLPIHGAGAVLDGHYFGIVAPSGSGKSTALWELLKSGAFFANDDMISIRLENDMPIAYPAMSLHPRLHKEVLKRDKIDIAQYENVASDEDKFWVPVSQDKRWSTPQKLSALFLLHPSEVRKKDIEIVRVPVEVATDLIGNNLQGLWLIQKYLHPERILTLCRMLAQAVPVYTLHYQKHFEVLPHLIEAMRSTLDRPVQTEAVI